MYSDQKQRQLRCLVVVRMERGHGEWELRQQGFEQRHQEPFRDAWHGPHVFVLRDLVNDIDQIQTLDAVPVALVDRVHTQVPRHSLRVWRRTQRDADR